MLSQAKVCLNFVIDGNDVSSTNRLRLVENEVFVLTILAREVLLEFDVEVCLH